MLCLRFELGARSTELDIALVTSRGNEPNNDCFNHAIQTSFSIWPLVTILKAVNGERLIWQGREGRSGNLKNDSRPFYCCPLLSFHRGRNFWDFSFKTIQFNFLKVYFESAKSPFFLPHIRYHSLEFGASQCDQIWQILAHFQKSTSLWQIFDGLFIILWQICDIIGLILIVTNGQILKNNLTTWSHCLEVAAFVTVVHHFKHVAVCVKNFLLLSDTV